MYGGMDGQTEGRRGVTKIIDAILKYLKYQENVCFKVFLQHHVLYESEETKLSIANKRLSSTNNNM
jgi:hypothetical protein